MKTSRCGTSGHHSEPPSEGKPEPCPGNPKTRHPGKPSGNLFTETRPRSGPAPSPRPGRGPGLWLGAGILLLRPGPRVLTVRGGPAGGLWVLRGSGVEPKAVRPQPH